VLSIFRQAELITFPGSKKEPRYAGKKWVTPWLGYEEVNFLVLTDLIKKPSHWETIYIPRKLGYQITPHQITVSELNSY